MSRTVRACLLPLGVLVAVACAVVVTWWLVGDISADGITREQLDHVIDPPSWSKSAVRTAGGAALCLGVLALAGVLRAISCGTVDRRWRRVALVLGGLYVGFAGRVATAGVVGANFGFGLVMMFGLVVGGALNAWGVVARSIEIAADQPALVAAIHRLLGRNERPVQ